MRKVVATVALTATFISIFGLAGLGVRQVYRSFQERPDDADGERIMLTETLIVHTPNGDFAASGGEGEIVLNSVTVTPER